MHADNKPIKSSRPVLASLAAFLRAGLRPHSALARAIVTVLVIKLFAVLGMMTYQHYADRRAEADAAGVALRLGPSSMP
jgi:hypothetical protein